MYDYDQLHAAAYAFLRLGVITRNEYHDITTDIDELVALNDERISFE